jgi:hypothetical protein
VAHKGARIRQSPLFSLSPQLPPQQFPKLIMPFNQGLWKLPSRLNSSHPTTRRTAPLRNTVGIHTDSVVDISPKNFWDHINPSSPDTNVISISADLIRDRVNGSTLSWYDHLSLLTVVRIFWKYSRLSLTQNIPRQGYNCAMKAELPFRLT